MGFLSICQTLKAFTNSIFRKSLKGECGELHDGKKVFSKGYYDYHFIRPYLI